jgi:transcription antitermination factor NusG
VRDSIGKAEHRAFSPDNKANQYMIKSKKGRGVPIFKGVCFVRLSLADRLAVLQSQGVVGLVGCAARPEPIPDEEIDSLKTLLKNSSVVSGPLQGIKGRLVREARYARLVLSLIQRSVAVEIDVNSVVPAQGDIGL